MKLVRKGLPLQCAGYQSEARVRTSLQTRTQPRPTSLVPNFRSSAWGGAWLNSHAGGTCITLRMYGTQRPGRTIFSCTHFCAERLEPAPLPLPPLPPPPPLPNCGRGVTLWTVNLCSGFKFRSIDQPPPPPPPPTQPPPPHSNDPSRRPCRC